MSMEERVNYIKQLLCHISNSLFILYLFVFMDLTFILKKLNSLEF